VNSTHFELKGESKNRWPLRLHGLRPSLVMVQFVNAPKGTVTLLLASQGNGHRKVSLDKDSIFKVECG
jgi:hypothetical protein